MKNEKAISSIIQFVTEHPESTVSRRIYRETLGQAPTNITSELVKELQNKLEIADEFTIEGYHYLIR